MTGAGSGRESTSAPASADSPLVSAPLLLASASPRRAEILSMLGIAHDVVPARVDEAPRPDETPEAYVERLAREKAAAVRAERPDAWVLAGDTTVALGSRILEKPADAADAVRMLMELSGREHRVATGLALAAPEAAMPPALSRSVPLSAATRSLAAPPILSGVDLTRVRFRPFDRETAEAYAATGEPMDKAGAYGIQGLGSTLVTGIDGDFTTVVGLSVPLLVRLLDQAGRPWTFPSSVSDAAVGDSEPVSTKP